jgi:ABC-type polysaccharide/polyol phosphate export permease
MKQRRTITAEALPLDALEDLSRGCLRYEIWWGFAVFDIKQRFRRSTIGPFWLTLSMGVLIGALSLVFSTIAKMRLEETLPYISAGVICWTLLSTCINEGSTIFISNAGQIRAVPIDLSFYLYRMVARNVMIFLFNMAIYFVVLIIFPPGKTLNYFLFIPGFILYMLNILWVSLALGILSARYRDVPQIAANVMQVLFIFTPVFWSSETLSARPAFVIFNPAYHLLEVVREPLLGARPGLSSWAVAFAAAVFGCVAAVRLYQRAYARIAYWV